MKKCVYKGVDEVVYYEKLDNGIEVFMYPSKTARNFYLTFNVKFGSMDVEFKKGKEKKYTTVPNGTAHFLEHQMFQEDGGETAFTKFAKLGSSVNAFTSYNQTCYEVIAGDNFKENLEILLDYVQNPVFKAGSVSQEKGIIKEEISMYDNAPMSVLNFGLEYNINQVDHHKYTISGTYEDIKEITPDVLMKAYETFYTPENMFIVLTGKFNPHEALGIIKANQNKKTFKAHEKITVKKPHEPLEVANPYEERQMDVGVPKLKIGYKLDKAAFKGFKDIEIKIYLDAILQSKFGPTSDLLEGMLDENLLMYDLATAREIRDDYILLSFECETDYKEEVIDLIRKELKNIKVTKEELERAKRTDKANFILHFNDILSVAEDIEDDILADGKIRDDIFTIYDEMNVSAANKIASAIKPKHESIFYIDRLTV
ncbi:MAG TPA: hypothetical protein DCY94_03640 [Firmicutes bacterium]|nr:hypothetical protein [Bacillota bacterium]